MKNSLIKIILFLILPLASNSQSDRALVKKGNEQYKAGKYSDAEISYRKSLEKNKNNFAGGYNLGNALYKEKKYEEAAREYSSASSTEKDKSNLSRTYHNLGNAFLKAEKYQESVDAFKQALKNNPDDEETRYNLAYAISKLQQQQQQQNKDNKDNKNQDKKDQKQQQKDQKDQQKKDQQQQQKQDQQKQKEEQQKQQQVKKDKISKEDAERILQALKDDEKNLQKKLARKESTRMNIEKQW